MYDLEKERRVEEDLQRYKARREPLTKEKQLNHGRIKPKRESTFGKPKQAKEKRNDIIDDNYSNWLGKQPCIITGRTSKRGAGVDNIHCHHIDGRNGTRNDYRQVPLMGFVHSWGGTAYHNNTKADFIKKNGLIVEDIIEFFNDCADELLKKYVSEGGTLKDKYTLKNI